MHDLRRAAEMEEGWRTLDALGTGSAMRRATLARQNAIGLRAMTPAATLDAEVAALLGPSKN